MVSLPKNELEPQAKAYLEIVSFKTEEIAECQVELLHNPAFATDDAFQPVANLVEERAGISERFNKYQ